MKPSDRRNRAKHNKLRGPTKRSLDRIYRKYHGFCYHCKEWMPREEASREHLLPVREYPQFARDETIMVLAHKGCNK